MRLDEIYTDTLSATGDAGHELFGYRIPALNSIKPVPSFINTWHRQWPAELQDEVLNWAADKAGVPRPPQKYT